MYDLKLAVTLYELMPAIALRASKEPAQCTVLGSISTKMMSSSLRAPHKFLSFILMKAADGFAMSSVAIVDQR